MDLDEQTPFLVVKSARGNGGMVVAVRRFMRIFFWVTVCVLLIGGLTSGLAKTEVLPKARMAKFQADVKPVLQRVCVGCHGPDKQKGKFRVDTLNPDLLNGGDVDWWLEVFGVIGNGEMPPEDTEVHLQDADRAVVVDWLSREIQQASRVARSAQGLSLIHI